MPQNSLGPCVIHLFGQYSKKTAWVFKVQLKDRFIQNNPFLKLWVTDQKCLQKILRSGLSGLDFQRRLLRLHPPPATGREGKRAGTPGAGGSSPPGGRGDSPPGKTPLGSFPPSRRRCAQGRGSLWSALFSPDWPHCGHLMPTISGWGRREGMGRQTW